MPCIASQSLKCSSADVRYECWKKATQLWRRSSRENQHTMWVQMYKERATEKNKHSDNGWRKERWQQQQQQQQKLTKQR